ncbi:STM4015 family protein [Actinomadura rugatobispora]|uniref:STM4015 family protein n=1 Tax=Actinomadura rugatobispora TaxID=1994 RepID=A0ABW1A6J0_9ACTN|nr:STM4015 family protein [Actinomadura rugatobispora]
MTINSHLTEFGGLPVAVFDAETDPETAELPPAASRAWRVDLSSGWQEEKVTPAVLDRFTGAVDSTAVTHLIMGHWGIQEYGDPTPVEVLTAAADRFPALRALFLGDIVMEEREISWIEQCDITPLFAAFPGLETLEVRGAEDLGLKPVRAERLKRLRFESGGLPGQVVRGIAACDFPALEHLDLWLGTENYGGNATVDDLAPILSGERLPSLRHLGLEDSEIQDEIAAAVAAAPIVARLESLSLAMGTLTDRGAESLLSGQPLTHLASLDLSHHYMTPATADRLRAALPGVKVDVGDGQDPDDDWPYVAIAE